MSAPPVKDICIPMDSEKEGSIKKEDTNTQTLEPATTDMMGPKLVDSGEVNPSVDEKTPNSNKDSFTSAGSLKLSPEPSVQVKNNGNGKQPASSSTKKPRSSGGLSELSKQLRVLQAKNEAQSIEMDRLQRQLRILSDLEGISLHDLRRALEQACEAEAHGELQHRVASLRAQLEAASLSRQAASDESAARHQVATLQLRIGELEELEQKQRAEISSLYEQLGEQQANTTRLQAGIEEERAKSVRLERELQQLREKQSSAAESKALPLPVTTSGANNSDKQKDPLPFSTPSEAAPDNSEQLELMAASLREARLEIKILQYKLDLSEQQRKASEEAANLREAQFKARSMVQEERMKDLNQQTSSLYAAFEMVQQEHSEREETRNALESNLNDADAEVARQVHGLDQSSLSLGHSSRSVGQNPGSVITPPASPLRSPAPGSPDSHAVPTTPPAIQAKAIVAGQLLFRSNNVMKTWKKRHVVLYSTMAHHILDLGGTKGGHTLHFGVSRVEVYPKHALAFTVTIDPKKPTSPVLHAAALNAEDYDRWMSALTEATTGSVVENVML